MDGWMDGWMDGCAPNILVVLVFEKTASKSVDMEKS